MGDKRKPWEEMWYASDEPCDINIIVGDDGCSVFQDVYGNSVDDDIRLAAAAPDLVRALLAVEYKYIGEGDGPLRGCPWCNGFEPGSRGNIPGDIGHDPGCPRQAALRKAGVIE